MVMEPSKVMGKVTTVKLPEGGYDVTFADGLRIRVNPAELDRGQDLIQVAFELRQRAGL